MSETVLESYLISLGFGVDDTQYVRFQAAVKGAASVVESHTSGVVKNLLGWQSAITGAFVAIGGGILGLADKVAMQDQQFRLTGLHMFMAQDQAKGLTIAMDALGASMNDIAWDPELHSRFDVLMKDQQAMQHGLGPNFEDQMKSIRDIRFEFTRLHVELEYGLMGTVNQLFEKMGLGSGGLLKKLQSINDYIIAHMPQIQAAIANYLVPILKDVWQVVMALEDAFKAGAVAFTNLVGALTGDQSLMGTKFNLEKTLGAVIKITQGFADFASAIFNVEMMLAHLASALALTFEGHFKDAAKELKAAVQEINGKVVLGIAGAAVGSMLGPEGTVAGYALGTGGAALLGFGGAALGGHIDRALERSGTGLGGDDFARLVNSVMRIESGGHQYDRSGNVLTSSAGARGLMQIMPATAAAHGMNADDPQQNVIIGELELKSLLAHYHGSVHEALMAYNWGSGNLDHARATGAAIPVKVQQYAANGMAGAGMVSDVHINSLTINVPDHLPDRKEAQKFVVETMREVIDRQTQANMKQLAAGGHY